MRESDIIRNKFKIINFSNALKIIRVWERKITWELEIKMVKIIEVQDFS